MSDFIKIEIKKGEDTSIQCISALQQVMEHFRGKLSANGYDRQAVYSWFKKRHRTRTPKLILGRD